MAAAISWQPGSDQPTSTSLPILQTSAHAASLTSPHQQASPQLAVVVACAHS